MMQSWWRVLLGTTTFAAIWCYTCGVEVETSGGTVRGLQETVEGVEVDIFYGIPYAAPPVEELRFKAPHPAEPWEGIRDATQKPNACIQVVIHFHEL